MALIEIGYRRFHGERRGRFLTWAVIAQAAIEQNWKARALRVITLVAWAPLLYFSLYFFGIGQMTQSGGGQLTGAAQIALGWFDQGLMTQLGTDPGSIRAALWAFAFYYLINITLLLATLLIPATVGPGLIADDRLHGALPLYFSRPVTTLDYILGKLAAICFFLAMVSLFPMVALYGIGVLTSPTLEVLNETWPVLLSILAVSIAFILPTGALVLFFSSLTSRRGVLAFWWIGFVAGTQMASAMVRSALGIQRWGQQSDRVDYSSLISYGRSLHGIADGLLGIEAHATTLAEHSRVFGTIEQNLRGQVDWRWSAAVVGGISLLALTATLLVVRRSEKGKS